MLGWEARREPWTAARAHAPTPRRPRSDGPPSPRMEPSKKLDSAGALPANPPLKLHPERGAGPAVLVPEQGGYKERFVKAVEDKYKCEKCRLVLCSPKQTECGHRFCETCMGALLRWVPQARVPLPSAPHEASPLGPLSPVFGAQFCWRRSRSGEEPPRPPMVVVPFGVSPRIGGVKGLGMWGAGPR